MDNGGHVRLSKSLLCWYKEAVLAITEGVPGSGKSFWANIKQVEWLLAGQPVLTNLRIKSIPKWRVGQPGEYVFLEDTDFDINSLGKLPLLEKLSDIKERFPKSHPLVVIDECHDIFNARNWKVNDKGGFFSWIAQHRHMGVSVLLITQDYSNIDKFLRGRCQEFQRVENLVKDPKLGWFLWVIGKNIHRSIFFPNKKGAPNERKSYGFKIFFIKGRAAARYSSGQMHKLSLKDTFHRPSDLPRKLVVLFVFCMLVWGGAIGSRFLKAGPKEENDEIEFEVVEAPLFEAKIEGAFLQDDRVVLMTDQGDVLTTSTDIYEWQDRIGEKYVLQRRGATLRPWLSDLVDQQKKTALGANQSDL